MSESRGLDVVSGVRPYTVPVVITLLVLLGAAFGPAALGRPGTGATPAGVSLEVGPGYLLLAPVFNILDTLSVLTIMQHYAVLASLIAIFIAWRLFRTREQRGLLRRAGVELGVALACLLGLAAFYGFGMVGPRPMAAVAVADSQVLVLDVHSHTQASHDSRPGFTAADRREWHASAGFDAVYVADHRTWDGYEAGEPANPALAGQGTVLLPALEIKYAGKYASALGPAWRYRPAMEGNHLIPDSLYQLVREGAPPPTLVLTIPGGLDSIPSHSPDTIGYVAVEVSDAAPRGLEQGRRERQRILRMSDSLNLAPVAATNNHGWGRTAAAWTLMRLPGWQAMTPEELNTAIERKLHEERQEATWVVERRTPYPGSSPVALAATLPAITWQMFGGMGPDERVSWLLWTWGLALLVVPALRRPTSARGA